MLLIPSFYHVILLGKKQGPGGPKSTTKMRLLDGFPGITKGLGPSELGLGPQAPWRTAVFSADFVLGTQQGPNEKGNGGNTTLWLCQQFAIENGPVEIVDFPIEYGDFPHLWTMLGHHQGGPRMPRHSKEAKSTTFRPACAVVS